MRILAAWMGREQSISVLRAVLLWRALPVLSQMADPDWLPAGREILAMAAMPLLLAAEPGSDWQLAWAQLLGSTAVTSEQLDLLTGLLDGTAEIPALPSTPSCAGRCCCGSPAQAGQATPRSTPSWRWITAIWASRGDAVRALLGKALFPYTAASPELLSQIDEFLADPALEPGLARIVTECRDVVEKALRAPDAAGLTSRAPAPRPRTCSSEASRGRILREPRDLSHVPEGTGVPVVG